MCFFRRQRLGLGPSFLTSSKSIGPSIVKTTRLARTRTPSKYVHPASPPSSSVIVEVSSIKRDEPSKSRKDSVELSMEEKRKFGGQEVAAEKLRSRLLLLQKGKEEDAFLSIKTKLPGPSKMTEAENFMARFPYKSCQRSIIGDLRKKRSLSQPGYGR